MKSVQKRKGIEVEATQKTTSHSLPKCHQTDFYLPPESVYLPRLAAERMLGISPSYLRRDCAVLRQLSPKGFVCPAHARGYVRSTIEVLWEFRVLVRSLGRRLAIQTINQHMETIYEQRRQGSYQSTQTTTEFKWATPPDDSAA